jgi:hypothetical protein
MSTKNNFKVLRKHLKDIFIADYTGEETIDDFSITTQLTREKEKENSVECHYCVMVGNPVNKQFDFIYEVLFQTDGKLSEENFLRLSDLTLMDCNYLFMSIMNQLVGEYVSLVPVQNIRERIK